jgi:hypothetical protein
MIRPAPNHFGASFQSMSALRSSDIQAGRVGTAVDASGVSPALTLFATCLGLFLGQVDTTTINLASRAGRW